MKRTRSASGNDFMIYNNKVRRIHGPLVAGFYNCQENMGSSIFDIWSIILHYHFLITNLDKWYRTQICYAESRFDSGVLFQREFFYLRSTVPDLSVVVNYGGKMFKVWAGFLNNNRECKRNAGVFDQMSEQRLFYYSQRSETINNWVAWHCGNVLSDISEDSEDLEEGLTDEGWIFLS